MMSKALIAAGYSDADALEWLAAFEAEQLPGAANAKLGEALAIAERNAAFNADRQWFKARPDRSYRARLATQQEIEDLHTSGAWPPGWVADESCFVWAIVRGSRTRRSTLSCRRRRGLT